MSWSHVYGKQQHGPIDSHDTRKEHPCVQETYNREHGATPKSIEWVRALRKHQGPRRPVNQSKKRSPDQNHGKMLVKKEMFLDILNMIESC